MSRHPRRRQRGLSLIELMIASTLGVLGVAAVGGVFLSGSRNYRQDQNIAMLNGELSYAMAQITRDLEMAGYWAPVRDPDLIQRSASLSVSNDCGATAGWAYQDLTAVTVDDNVQTAAAAHTAHPCLPASDISTGSDIVTIKRVHGSVDGTDTSATGMVLGRIYLRTHFAKGLLYGYSASPPAMATPYQDWEYRPSVYYVQPYTLSAAESPAIPSLCRMALQASGGTAGFARQCVAQGVENLQIEIGVDSDGDGVADYFVSAPSAAQMNQAVAARIYLLVRSATRDPNHQDPRSYQIGNMATALVPAGTDAQFYRKTLSSEVVLRNPRSLRGLAYQ